MEEEDEEEEDWEREILERSSNGLQLETHEEEEEDDQDGVLEVSGSTVLQVKLRANSTAFSFVMIRSSNVPV